MPRSTENKLIHIPYTAGVNQATSPRLSPTGTFDLVQNCRISGSGVLESRPGTLGISGATSTDLNAQVASKGVFHILQGDGSLTNVEAPCFACTVGDALLVGNSFGDAFAFSTIWQFQGRFSTALPVRRRFGVALDDLESATGFGNAAPDIAANSAGYIAVCAVANDGGLHFYIEDADGVRVYYMQTAVLPAYSRARVVAVATTNAFILIAQTGTALVGFEFVISAGAATQINTGSVGTLSSAATSWDVAAFGDDWFIAFQSAATAITLARYSDLTVDVSLAFTIPSSIQTFMSLYGDIAHNNLWLGMYDAGNDVSYAMFDVHVANTITNVRARTLLVNLGFAGPPLFGTLRSNTIFGASHPVFYCFKQLLVGGANTAATWYGLAFANSATHTTPAPVWHYVPVSKPDDYNRVWCLHQSHSSNQTISKLVLLRFADLNAPPAIELSLPNQLFLISPAHDSIPDYFVSIARNTTRSFFAIGLALQVFYLSKALFKIDVLEYTTAEQEPHRAAQQSGITTAIAGQPVEFFGQSVAIIQTNSSGGDRAAFGGGASEIGFPNAPIIFTATPAASGGSLEAGTRSYRATFEWIDFYGRRHQSAPSAPITGVVTTGSASSVVLVISTLDVTQRQAQNTNTNVVVRVFRTLAGGTDFHELTPSVVAFDSTDGLITFSDTDSDANISQTGFLYTDGGALQNDLAPSCRFFAASEDRLWFGGLWDQNIIQCSFVIVPGEPIQCTDDPSHQIVLPGECTGLAYQDGNIVAFTDSQIYLIPSTQGPNNQGVGGFPSPTALTRSLGCVDYRSIVETNIGIFFQSHLGIYVLPRGFGPAQYVGVGVQDVMISIADAGPTVLGAVAHISRSNHLAQFLVATAGQAETAAQTLLSYDLDSNQWFEDTLPWATREIACAERSTPLRGLVCMLASLNSTAFSTPVLYETATQNADADGNASTVAFAQAARTNWIHPFGLGGWGKIKRVLVALEIIDPAKTAAMQITYEHDGQAAITPETSSYTITPGANNPVQYREFIPAVQACTSVRITLSATCATSSVKFISLTLELEPSDGARLLAPSEKN